MSDKDGRVRDLRQGIEWADAYLAGLDDEGARVVRRKLTAALAALESLGTALLPATATAVAPASASDLPASASRLAADTGETG